MREIKFRAWNEVLEKMYSWNEFLNTNMKQTFIAPESTAMILMQYTGLKDKNGKEIYEGDRVYIIPEDEYGEVEWDIESARFIVVYDDVITDFDNWNGKDLEVVGTIYD